jgi:hypothetical protein
MYYGLLCVHSYKGTETNGYLDRQWYDHIDIVKNGQQKDVTNQDGYIIP